jgi:hypothetical protein
MTRPVNRGSFKRSCRSCGWSQVYATEGFAKAGKRRHRCERSNKCPDCGGPKTKKSIRCQPCAIAALDIDRTPKPCHHKRANHQHGTYAAFTLDGCRCQPCSDAQHAYEQQRKRLHAYGRWDGWVDAEPVREHLRSLMAQGMGSKRIMLVGDLPSGSWTKLMYGGDGRPITKRIRRETAERLLALEVDIADGRYVSSLGATRRVQALIALGWSQARIADRLGLRGSNFTALVHGRGLITQRRDRDVRALYEALSMTLPPETNQRERIAASRSRRNAAERGWLPPLAWDDDRMDDPTYTPLANVHEVIVYDHAVVERYLANGERPVGRHLTHDEAAEIVHRLRGRGESTKSIENRGFKPERYTHPATTEGAAS